MQRDSDMLLTVSPESSPESFQNGALRLFGGAWHYKINQNSTYSVSRFNLGGLGALFGGAKPTKPPRGDGTWEATYIYTLWKEAGVSL